MNNESRSRILTRTGSEPRIHCCIFDTIEKRTSFIDPKYNSIELTGKGKHHIEPKESSEINLFSKKIMKNMPNSNRTLIHKQENDASTARSVRHCSSIQKMRSSRLFSPESKNSLIYYNEPDSTERKEVIRDYRTKDSLKLSSEQCKVKTEYKRCIKPSTFNHYTSTSQIIQLPGGIKRDINAMKQLNENPKCPRNSAFCSKVNNEYCSKVFCLPGRFTKANQQCVLKTGRQIRKHNQSDIFNVNDSLSDCNSNRSFRHMKKKSDYAHKGSECNTEREFMFELSRKGRAQNIKVNLFKSQIEIS